MRKARLRQRSFCRLNRIFRRRVAQCAVYFLGAWLAGAEPLVAFQTPLSEEAVREAYFLGQRHDETVTSALEKYSQYFPLPDHGPQIAHRGLRETVEIEVAIRFTDSYPAIIPSGLPTSRGSQPRLVPRSYDFWRDFAVTVFDGDLAMEPSSQEGRPDYDCTKSSCFLIGATVLLDFAADAFASQDVTVQVEPPEGEQFVTGLDLSRLR